MSEINRSLIILRPKQPFLDWACSLDDDSNDLTIENLNEDSTAYLIPEIWEDDGKPKLHYAVQLALYTDILERLGRSHGRTPFVWDIHGSEVPYDLMEMRGKRNPRRLWDDYQDYLAQARNIVKGVFKTLPAYSTGVCKNCVWYTSCLKNLEAANDLTLIPELGRSKRDARFDRIASIRELAAINQADFIDEGKTVFSGIGPVTLAKMQERAKLLTEHDGKPYLTVSKRLGSR